MVSLVLDSPRNAEDTSLPDVTPLPGRAPEGAASLPGVIACAPLACATATFVNPLRRATPSRRKLAPWRASRTSLRHSGIGRGLSRRDVEPYGVPRMDLRLGIRGV